jgi:hypothetical protein
MTNTAEFAGADGRLAWIVAFTKARKELPSIGKDTSVTIKTDKGNYSYTYATLPDIIEKVTDVLRGNGFVIAQDVTGDGSSIAVQTRIYHKGGHVETFGPLALKVQGDAKAAGSAITYARRYALCAALGIAPDEDDDGQKASEPAPKSDKQWLWEESAVFKAWSPDERAEAIKAAMKYLGIDAVQNRDEAVAVLNHVSDIYDKRPGEGQEAMPV